MSRRRKAPDRRPPRCKVICTDQGQHEPTFLGWVRFLAGDDGPVSEFDLPDDHPDELQFLESANRARVSTADGPREWDVVASIDEYERVRDGHRGLEQDARERWKFATCERCRGDVVVRGDHFLAIVREAVRSGVSELDVSRLRGPLR